MWRQLIIPSGELSAWKGNTVELCTLMWYVEKKIFLMELFNERLGESDYVMMDCSFGGGVFLIFLAGN